MSTKSLKVCVRAHTYTHTQCQAMAITKCQMSITMRKYISKVNCICDEECFKFWIASVLLNDCDYYSNSRFINCRFGNIQKRLCAQLYLIRTNRNARTHKERTKAQLIKYISLSVSMFCFWFVLNCIHFAVDSKQIHIWDKRTANFQMIHCFCTCNIKYLNFMLFFNWIQLFVEYLIAYIFFCFYYVCIDMLTLKRSEKKTWNKIYHNFN